MTKENITNNDAIGSRIRNEREKLGLSREEFAEIIGLSTYYVGQLERGERQMSLPVLIKISNCLHISLDYIVFGEIFNDKESMNDNFHIYESCSCNKDTEINDLLNKCSKKELELFKKLIKTIIPYINRK